MKRLLCLFKDPSSCFYFIASLFTATLLLQQFHVFEWLAQFLLVLKPLWIGGIMAFFLQPLINVQTTRNLSRVLLVYILFIASFLLLFVLLFFLIVAMLPQIFMHFQAIYPDILAFVEHHQIFSFFDSNQFQEIVMNGYEWLMPILQNMLSFFTTFAFSVMISFFISLESHRISNEIMKYVKNYRKIFALYDIFSTILRQYIYSTLFDIIYIVISTSVILFLFRTPYPLLLSILLACMNLFPYVGALLGSALLVLIHFLVVHEHTGWLILVILINSQFEGNVLHAWICTKTMKVHPLFLFIALLINEYLFGIIGVILSPIVASSIQLAMVTYSEYLNRKNIGGWEEIVPLVSDTSTK